MYACMSVYGLWARVCVVYHVCVCVCVCARVRVCVYFCLLLHFSTVFG